MKTLRKLLTLVAVPLVLWSCAGSCGQVRVNLPRDSYALIYNNVTVGVCSENECIPRRMAMTGSGAVVASGSGLSIILTAGHVCIPHEDNFVSELGVVTYNSQSYPARILQVVPEDDVCVLYIPVELPSVTFSSSPPEIGDVVHSLSSPLGMKDHRMVPQFRGNYVGKSRKVMARGAGGTAVVFTELDSYTIPTTAGSSGGPIFNQRGEMVGMSIMARVGFENFALSSRYETLKVLVRASKEAVARASIK